MTDGSLVGVKRLKEERMPGGELQFQTEVEMISMAVHRNLLRLRGFCMTPTERLLVYPYMANGSVASCLRGRSSVLFFLAIVNALLNPYFFYSFLCPLPPTHPTGNRVLIYHFSHSSTLAYAYESSIVVGCLSCGTFYS